MKPIEVITPTLLNSWVTYNAVYGEPRYYKDAFGNVTISGAMKSGTLAAPAFYLEEGYRPKTQLEFWSGSERILIFTSGEVRVQEGSAVNAVLSGTRFNIYE